MFLTLCLISVSPCSILKSTPKREDLSKQSQRAQRWEGRIAVRGFEPRFDGENHPSWSLDDTA